MMKVLIVEDEELAAERLQDLLMGYNPEIKILNILDTISSTVSFLKKEEDQIDLILLDIQLADGKSFEIFQQCEVYTPIIFTTAYDEFALEAFRVNSIDYLMKPITLVELKRALDKFLKVRSKSSEPVIPQSLAKELLKGKAFKQRFLVKTGERMYFKDSHQIAYFYAIDKFCYLVTKESSQKYLIDYTLEQLQDLLDPSRFFRINRSIIVYIDAIKEVRKFQGNRLRIFTHSDSREEMIVSRQKVQTFYNWLDT
jgi:DNA-binding LytR/AlgR family response regulator